MRKRIKATILAALLCINSYASAETPSKKTPREPNTEEIKKLQTEVLLLRLQINGLKSSTATVRTDSKEYDIARTKFGPFIVSQRGLTEFLDGYKLRLALGNTTSVTFSGATLNLEWGPPYDEKEPAKWFNSRKKKEVQLTDTFRPGSYTIVEVVISPAKPDEVKEIEVGIDLNQLSLREF